MSEIDKENKDVKTAQGKGIGFSDLLATDTEVIDKLYLELSQFTKARTKRDIQLDMLLSSVESKYKNETRFDTALRYIQERELNKKLVLK